MSAVTRVTIVRHGEAVVNLERGIAAADCRGLTARGRGQIDGGRGRVVVGGHVSPGPRT